MLAVKVVPQQDQMRWVLLSFTPRSYSRRFGKLQELRPRSICVTYRAALCLFTDLFAPAAAARLEDNTNPHSPTRP